MTVSTEFTGLYLKLCTFVNYVNFDSTQNIERKKKVFSVSARISQWFWLHERRTKISMRCKESKNSRAQDSTAKTKRISNAKIGPHHFYVCIKQFIKRENHLKMEARHLRNNNNDVTQDSYSLYSKWCPNEQWIGVWVRPCLSGKYLHTFWCGRQFIQ